MHIECKEPLASVIMPAFNASKYIQNAIDSVIAQTFTNWELLIDDDGSTDDSVVIIERNVEKDSRIKVFQQQNSKQGAARNLAISNSKALYLAFLDSDDIWDAEKLAIQTKEILHYNVDLVFSDVYVFKDTDKSNKTKTMNTFRGFVKGANALDLFVEGNKIPILSVLVKRAKNNFSE